MIRYRLLLIMLLLIPLTGNSLSVNSKISVLTSDPGVEYYTIFGHTAIRVSDDSLNIDRVYNFGTFDFNEPFFYFRFINGNLKYFLSIAEFKSFMSYSYYEKRKVHEQILDITLKEKNKIFNNLENCYNSSERFYTYDFYYDNCATRVRDVIFKSTDGPIVFNSVLYSKKTFRQLLKPYISGNYWVDFGINLVLGKESDKIAKPADYMFLPFYIMNILQSTPIVKDQNIILDASVSKVDNFDFSHLSPWLVVLIIILFSVWSKSRKIAFFTLTSVIGFIGVVLLLVSIITENAAFSNNLNVCWTIPSLIIIFVRNKRVNDILKSCYIAMLLLLILCRNCLHQDISSTFIPWILCLIIMLLIDLRCYKLGI